MEFYRRIKNLDLTKHYVVGTVISQNKIGEKIIWCNGKKVYTTDKSINWPTVEDLQSVSSQIIESNGYRIYIESMVQERRLVICGAGHISIPLIQMGKMLGFSITVIEDRLSFANNARRAGADQVICDTFQSALKQVDGDENTYFVIVTRGHRYDRECLESIISKKNAYIGMIGSKVRTKKVIGELEEKGILREDLEQVYTPIGLNIKAETPEEIAVAIIAEIIQLKNAYKVIAGFTNEIMNEILNEKNLKIPKALVTIISRHGSAPREVGTKMLVFSDGRMVGTIGGGCVEASLRRVAMNCISNNRPKLIENDMTGRGAEEDGMVCGGVIEVLVEPI